MDIKCLIDTNILIQLEEPDSEGVFKTNFAEFSELYHKYGIKVFCHPHSIDDISRDKNKERQNKTLASLKKYPILQKIPIATTEILEDLFGGISKANDLVDCQLLYVLKENIIHYLISEDDGVHRRAKYAKLNDRVFSVKEFSNFLLRLFEPQSVLYPNLTEELVYSLSKDDPIFHSVEEDYDDFNVWWTKCCEEHRKAWVVRVKNKMVGVCVLKDENGEKEYPGLGAKTLKLCTFKVDEQNRGNKYGELLLKNVFSFCVENKYTSTYLTAFPKHGYFSDFLKDFGFQIHHEKTKRGELVFFKTFGPPPKDLLRTDPIDFQNKFAPNFYFDEVIKKYVIPIRPHFHEHLFPELAIQTVLPIDDPSRSVPGNTIKKVYLSHANIATIERGSLLMFYRSVDHQEITTLGIAERSGKFLDLTSLVAFIGKRSVYSLTEIKMLIKKPVLAIEFRFIKHLTQPIKLQKLLKRGALNGPPQRIQSMPEDNFLTISDAVCEKSL